MSASLVGSEMCIRDRARAPPRPFSPRRIRNLLAQTSNQPSDAPRARAPSMLCLLYTSDAADDMQ
eukprot:15201213-Alexandrium_andersonii.AAC.1